MPAVVSIEGGYFLKFTFLNFPDCLIEVLCEIFRRTIEYMARFHEAYIYVCVSFALFSTSAIWLGFFLSRGGALQ